MRKTLGKGLQSLIPKKEPKMAQLLTNGSRKKSWLEPKKESIFNVEIDKIKPNPHQPRKEMSEEGLKEMSGSIREHGILQPLIVTKIERSTDWGRQVEYELVAGERRWRAAKMVGLPQVPVIIRDSSAYEKLELALVENLQRENLNPMEAARAFKQLHQDFKLKHSQIAQKVGKSRVTVTNTLRLLTLPPQAQKALAGGRISEGHGRAILMAKPAARSSIYQAIIRGNLDVRGAEEKARQLAVPRPYASGPKNILFKEKEKGLTEALGRRVSITQREGHGYLRIEFTDQKELDKLVNYLLKF